MKLAFSLVKENIPIAIQEVLSLCKETEYELIDNILILETNFKDFERLAYTRKVYQLLFIAYKNSLLETMQDFNWQQIYKENFCVRTNSDFPEKELAGYIWRGVKKPKVNLGNPKTEIGILKQKSKYLACKKLFENNEDFESRKAHLRPEPHPTSMHPRLARAVVNLTGISKGETLLDPMCGSGGILIEAGLMGIKTIGYDIDKVVLRKAEINLKNYKIKNFKLELKDALTTKEKYNYIVADLPYGLNTSPKNLKETYSGFFALLEKIMKKKAVLILPHFVNYRKLINKTSLKMTHEFSSYIHKSLTKKIIVLEN